MLPLQQAYEVQYSILEYLKATFSFSDRAVHEAFYKFITHPEDGIFKGPYVSLKLPFVKTAADISIPLDIKPAFPPYRHQYLAFQRLTTQDEHRPQSTLITTGTSSGKTECFMYPVLDYCYRQQQRPGIKVIILYPMNALATDQAKRLAEAIWNDERLKGKVTAGLFIGEGKDKKKFPTEMGENHIIENREGILDNPPDILLTNFKMLDYALMRSQFHRLWQHNFRDPELLQYLVLDELHTYDGAQGTDVANLIRRLKLKLSIPKGRLCAVGTSATIGTGEDAVQLLTDYASKVFGETFDAESVITEHRLSVPEFFPGNEEAMESFVPRQVGLLESRLGENETYADYLNRQKRLWQIPQGSEGPELGAELRKLKIVRDLISITNEGILSLQALVHKLADINAEFRKIPEWDAVNDINPREEIIHSILALISAARSADNSRFPFLYLQIQLWVRELSGVLRELGDKPVFTWKDKIGDRKAPKALPAYFCRECGASGWLGVKDDNKNHFFDDPKQVYEYFFSNHKNVYFINTDAHKHIEEYVPENQISSWMHVVDMTLFEKAEKNALHIHAVRKLRETRSRHICPECNTENTMGIIGTRVATLSSVTVAQVLASDLDPRPEKARKILAFTNSVQDAAHQAGFLEARNYRFTFRASLQKVINQNPQPLNLVQLQQQFADYWKQHSDSTGQQQEEAYYYRFFPADYHGRVDIDHDYRDLTKRFTGAFKNEFDLRMGWEVLSEFGYNAIIGRTLEKSGSSAVYFPAEKLEAVFARLQPWLADNNLGGISREQFLPFLNGILHRIRVRGGINHDYLNKFRYGDLKLWELNWMKDNRHFLNRLYHPRSRFPRLLTPKPHSQGLLDSTFTNQNNWYRSYYLKSFPLASSYPQLVNDFYAAMLRSLEAEGVMNCAGQPEQENYALEPAAVYVENKVATHACDTCGSELHVAASDQFTKGAKCLNYTCAGSYVPTARTRPNYYKLVYNRNQSPRIYATEHTGVLERKDRENKEYDFKERPRFNSLNAVVATSTLEMGIDIGTLNVAINNSVPPLPANFLQRVGRAGRSSGSAIVVNFVQAKAHDLFYYGEPRDMMAGEVATPGCYLEAREILRRHFLAYCLDNWAASDPVKNVIPGRMLTLQLLRTNIDAPEFLSARIIAFVREREQALLSRFEELYRPDLKDSAAVEDLKGFLTNGTCYERIRNFFLRQKEEYEAIEANIKELDAVIRSLPHDEERRALENERKALRGLRRLMDKRAVLEQMTNAGLLPNYAFPETGVTLNAWVKAGRAKASENLPQDHYFEIVRSSRSAIREFVPDNHFYSQGYKLAISGIHTGDWKDEGTLFTQRFCSNCDHIDTALSTNTEPVCPKCGDSSWASDKNKHIFIRLNAVKSINYRDKASLDDSSDDRESQRYRISRHLKFHKNSFQGAYGMKEIPFGIEYVKNVDVIELNLGLQSAVHANKISINQQEDVPHHGFVTCRYCGKSSSRFNAPKYDFHFGYCKHKDRAYAGSRDDVFEEVYLLREMKTEALKILLPVQEFDSEATINMFKAGLELGLRKYYKGNPQHLGIIQYAEFNAGNNRFDRYLVLYDQIPGGTGYLEKLFDPREFTDVIKKACNAIATCSCKAKGMDGCYRCIYSYGNQYIQEQLSRAKAEKLFKKIVDRSEHWESFSTGLGKLTSDGNIEESELEDYFIRVLRRYFDERGRDNVDFEEYVEDGVVRYKMRVSDGIYSYFYTIRPQFELGPENGVAMQTRADFLISLVSVEKEGVVMENASQGFRPIAVYLDGYTYHASAENNRFPDDFAKRRAISESNAFQSWTLTWDDIKRFDKTIQAGEGNTTAEHIDQLFADPVRFRAAYNIYRRIPYWMQYQSSLLSARNSMERLLWMLQRPLEAPEKLERQKGLYLSLLQERPMELSCNEADAPEFLANPNRLFSESPRATNTQNGAVLVFPDMNRQTADYALVAGVRLADLQIRSAIRLDPAGTSLDKAEWEYFWQVYNLVQDYVGNQGM